MSTTLLSRFRSAAISTFRSRDGLICGAVVVVGAATLAAIALHPAANRSLAERGALSMAINVGRALSLAGLAIALGLSRNRQALASGALFFCGAALGVAEKDRILSAILAEPETAYRLFLVDPFACILVGLLLAPSAQVRCWLLAPLAATFGGVIGFSTKLDNPDPSSPMFLVGGGAAVIWMTIAFALLARRLNGRWLQIVARILGSWLIAIGLLLGGAALAQRPTINASPAFAPPGTPWIPDANKLRPKQIPGIDPSVQP